MDAQNAKLYTYDIDIDLRGASGGYIIGGGYLSGDAVISKTGPSDTKKWKSKFIIAIYGGSLSLGVGGQGSLKANGNASTSQDWSPEHFNGPIEYYDLSLAWAFTAIGGSLGFSGINCYGSGLKKDSIMFNLSGFSQIDGYLLEAGINLSHGYLGGGVTQGSKSNPRPVEESDDRLDSISAANDVHFNLGDAWLTKNARADLGIICAMELRMFQNPLARLKIVGHADRSDTAERNKELSRLRAQNTYNAIADILGPKLAIPDDSSKKKTDENNDAIQTLIYGAGELEATKKGRPDHIPAKEDRRVDVTLNGRLLARLRADGKKG
jgi:flagellar motor protein MotB